MTWLIRFLLLSILLTLVVRSLRRLLAGVAQGMGLESGRRPPGAVEQGVQMVRDPVCGTFVVPGTSFAVRDEHGLHYFCSETCRSTFLRKTGTRTAR